MRYSKAIVQEVTHQEEARNPAVGWAGTQRRNDTSTWGQSISINMTDVNLARTGPDDTVTVASADQLTKVTYERPTKWRMKVVINLVRPSGETASWRVVYLITLGVGQAHVTLNRFHDFSTPAPGGLVQFEDDLEFPAQAIQVQVGYQAGFTGVLTKGPHSLTVTVLCSPEVQ